MEAAHGMEAPRRRFVEALYASVDSSDTSVDIITRHTFLSHLFQGGCKMITPDPKSIEVKT